MIALLICNGNHVMLDTFGKPYNHYEISQLSYKCLCKICYHYQSTDYIEHDQLWKLSRENKFYNYKVNTLLFNSIPKHYLPLLFLHITIILISKTPRLFQIHLLTPQNTSCHLFFILKRPYYSRCTGPLPLNLLLLFQNVLWALGVGVM